MTAVVSGRPLDGMRITDPVAIVRRRCRDAFRRAHLLSQLIPAIEDVLAADSYRLNRANRYRIFLFDTVGKSRRIPGRLSTGRYDAGSGGDGAAKPCLTDAETHITFW